MRPNFFFFFFCIRYWDEQRFFYFLFGFIGSLIVQRLVNSFHTSFIRTADGVCVCLFSQ